MTRVPVQHDAAISPSDYGPAFQDLSESHQRFVIELLDTGGDYKAAAAAAGFSERSGYYLARRPDVIQAIKEEGDARARSGAILAASTLIELARGAINEQVRFKAAVELLNRAGLLVERTQHLIVEHRLSEDQKIAEVKSLAAQLGLDATKLLGHAGVVTDAEFAPVNQAPQDDEDWTVGPQ